MVDQIKLWVSTEFNDDSERALVLRNEWTLNEHTRCRWVFLDCDSRVVGAISSVSNHLEVSWDGSRSWRESGRSMLGRSSRL